MKRKEVKNGHQMSPLMNLIGSFLIQSETLKQKKKLKLEGMLEDHKKFLYPNCEDGSTKLGTTLKLLRWKVECGLTDSSFEKMLKIMNQSFQNITNFPRVRMKQRRLSAL